VITIYQRNDRVLVYQVTDEAGTPLVLTGADIRFTLSTYPGGADHRVLEKAIGNGVVVTSEQTGEIEVHLSHVDTDLPPRTYQCEIVVVDIDGHRYTAGKDWLTILLSITREGDD
jgi:adenylosuccinate synthase